jgi:cell division protein FtsN
METLFMLIVATVLVGLVLLAYARMGSNKSEWKKEKSRNLEMIGIGMGMFIVAVVIAGLLG